MPLDVLYGQKYPAYTHTSFYSTMCLDAYLIYTASFSQFVEAYNFSIWNKFSTKSLVINFHLLFISSTTRSIFSASSQLSLILWQATLFLIVIDSISTKIRSQFWQCFTITTSHLNTRLMWFVTNKDILILSLWTCNKYEGVLIST